MHYIKKEDGIRLTEKGRIWDDNLPIVTIIIATYNSDLFYAHKNGQYETWGN